MTAIDDLGAPVRVERPVTSVVSLVPSLTEAIASTRPETLVGATDWCTHPAGLDVPRVRGTKNPNLAAIVAQRPQLVVANKEENRRIDVERLRAQGIPVWATVIESVGQALVSLERLFTDGLGWGVPQWLAEISRVWTEPAAPPRVSAAAAVWRDPWMVLGSRTYAGDVMRYVGLRNVYGDAAQRYPKVQLESLRASADVILLPDEPYPFSAVDGPEAFAGQRTVLVSGRALTWYGPAMLTARAELAQALGDLSSTEDG